MSELVILGAGGHAREVYWYALSRGYNQIVFVDETAGADSTLKWAAASYRVINDWRAFEAEKALSTFRCFVAAVGEPALKRRLVGRALEHGLRPAPTIIHDDAAVYGADCTVGAGGVIAPGCRLTTNIRVGDFVTLGINCAIGHDAVIGDYATCNPGCLVSGHVIVGAGTLIGAGACVREKLTIADNVTVGAQSCVVKDIDHEGVVVAGVPAKRLK
jgi:sugar O-acyltransferase (sialic acid O-acetyltransferase NeuD family)